MDYILLFDTIFFSSLFSTGIALLFSFFPRSLGQIKLIQILVAASFLADFIAAIADYVFGTYIPYIGASYRMVEFILLFEFFRLLFPSRKNFYLVRIFQVILPIIIVVIFSFDPAPFRITSSVIFSIYPVLYFRELIMEMKVKSPLVVPLFWINSAILLYFSGALFLFLFFEPLAQLQEVAAVISYMFHNLFLIIKNILFAIGFWVLYKMGKRKTTGDLIFSSFD